MRSPKLNQILLLLNLYKEGRTWRQMVGKQRFIATSQILEENQPTTRKVEITRGEWNFPRHTLYRHLKTLVEEGSVEKTQEPRKRGKRGELSTRYKIGMPKPKEKDKPWNVYASYCRLPVSRPGWPYDSRWFLGEKIEGRGVRMWPEEKKKFEQFFREDTAFKDAVLKAERARRKETYRQRRLKKLISPLQTGLI